MPPAWPRVDIHNFTDSFAATWLSERRGCRATRLIANRGIHDRREPLRILTMGPEGGSEGSQPKRRR